MRYMGFNSCGQVIGNSEDFTEGYTLVSDEVFAVHQEHPEYIWNGETLVNPYIPPPPPSLDELKQAKRMEVSSIFEYALQTGTATVSTSCGDIVVDARRTGVKNDLQNVEGIIYIMQVLGLEICPNGGYKCADDIKHPLTLSDMQAVKLAIIMAGAEAYAKKHMLEARIGDSITAEELEELVW